MSQIFVDWLESGAEFLNSIWLQQTHSASWFDEETKNCIRFLNASKHDAAIPIMMRYFQSNTSDIPKVVKAIVAFYALWRPAFPTNSLPDIYRNLLLRNGADNMAHIGGSLKSVADLKSYFRTKLEGRLGTPTAGQTFEDLWIDDSRQIFLTYESLKAICRLFVFLDMGQSIKSNLVPDDPWTVLDDIEHICASSTQPPLANVHRIGNLTFLPPVLNKSISNMGWNDKIEVYQFLASTQKPVPSPTQFSDGRALPAAIKTYLASAQCQAMAHLTVMTNQPVWGDTEIQERGTAMLKRVWSVLYTQWLH